MSAKSFPPACDSTLPHYQPQEEHKKSHSILAGGYNIVESQNTFFPN